MITGNEPINAVLESWRDENPEVLVCNDKGITIRQEFAKTAMLGLLSKYNLKTPEDQETICKLSVELADELIKQLNA